MTRDIENLGALRSEESSKVKQIIHSLMRLRAEALWKEDRFKLGKGEYKWEIGQDIYKALDHDYWTRIEYVNEKEQTILGFPFEINYKDKDVLKLWRAEND